MKLYQFTKYTFTSSSYTLSEATASKYTFTLSSYTFTSAALLLCCSAVIIMASKYTFTVRLTSDEDDILMMEGRGDFAARKKKNINRQPH